VRLLDSPGEERSMRIGWYQLAALVTIASACGSGERSRVDDLPKPIVHRGLAVFGHEVRSFKPCGSETSLWAVDSSGLLWDLYTEMTVQDPPYQSVFVTVEGRLTAAPRVGFGADYAGTLLVDEVLYVAREGFGCDFDWRAFRYRALGNEPFWTVDISTTSILLRSLGQDDQTWTLTQESGLDRGGRFEGEAAGTEPVTVEIQRQECRDTMSGTFFGYTAAVRVGESILTGCALKGTKHASTTSPF